MQVPSTPQPVMKLRGVKVHNLQDISVDIPLHQLVAITGISGSGKSSLAFDTIFAEGQRTLLETLPATIQAHLARLERPQAASLEGIPPAFMIRQRGVDLDQKLSLADWTNLSQKLLRLFTSHGEPQCPICSQNISNHSPTSILELIKKQAPTVRSQLAFLVPVNKKTEIKSLTLELHQAGFHRIHLVDQKPILSVLNQHCNSKSTLKTNKIKSKNSTLKLALLVITDRLLPGQTTDDRLLESISISLLEGAGLAFLLFEPNPLSAISTHNAINIDNQSWQYIPLFLGFYCDSCNLKLSIPDADNSKQIEQQLPPVSYSLRNFSYNSALSKPLRNWPAEFLDYIKNHAAENTIQQMQSWINWLNQLHLSHLALDTQLTALSTGEAQRLNLARAVNLGVVQAMFIIDEPCAGTHPQERQAIYHAIKLLKESGNSVILVEHDTQILHLADQIIDLGPQAGSAGGNIVYQGNYNELLNSTNSLTAKWINTNISEAYTTKTTHRWQTSPELIFTPANLPEQSWCQRIPLQRLVAITGRSGTGKRKLLHQIVFNSICQNRNWIEKLVEDSQSPHCATHYITGLEQIDDCVLMTGRPRKAHHAQTIITGIELYSEIRQLFAQTHEAKMKGYQAGDFSFSSARGKKCHKCKGSGVIQLIFQQFPPQKSICPHCQGGRFQPQMNEVLYRANSISQVLNQTIDDAFQFFRNIPKLQKGLFALKEAGLGYLTLGRNLNTLSGGEYQRFLLAQRILSGTGERILFLFEEPSIGLHPENKHQLLKLFFHLLELGHSIVMIENDPQLTSQCELIITLPL